MSHNMLCFALVIDICNCLEKETRFDFVKCTAIGLRLAGLSKLGFLSFRRFYWSMVKSNFLANRIDSNPLFNCLKVRQSKRGLEKQFQNDVKLTVKVNQSIEFGIFLWIRLRHLKAFWFSRHPHNLFAREKEFDLTV